jgi:hypothetical protein
MPYRGGLAAHVGKPQYAVDGSVEDGLATTAAADNALPTWAASTGLPAYRGGAVDARNTNVAGKVIDLAGSSGEARRSISILAASAPIW